MGRIIAVASNKGGVGKTSLAIELAYGLGAILVDLDYDAGGASGSWPGVGTVSPEWARRALLEGDGPGPRVVRREGLPDFVPSHVQYGMAVLQPETVTERLEAWSRRLERDLVVDTHPGYQPLAIGAMAGAHLTVIPVLLEERVLHAFRALIPELQGYPVVAIPYRVARWGGYHMAATRLLYERLVAMARQHAFEVGPAISEWRDWPRRRVNRALLASPSPGQWVGHAQAEFRSLVDWVRGRIDG
jgi:chromosome partitioning protein